ncbi:MAG: DUF692 family protein [Acidobacteria bacterium]|nr:DUF692 family protein [Acidobacteriota bacterium]
MNRAKVSAGAFYNPHLADEILGAASLVDHLAMADPPEKSDPHFSKIREQFTLLLHDFIGQLSDPVPRHSLQRARELADLYGSPWIAEHFQCVHTQDGRYNVDYVFPPLYTEEFLERYIENAVVLKQAVGRPLAIENIPRYFSVDLDEMTEGQFLRKFFETSGCSLILDISHAWLGAYYQGRSPQDYITDLPLEYVQELHIAGVAHYSDLEGPWIGPVEPTEEMLKLAAWTFERLPNCQAVTFDAFSTLLKPGMIPRTMERIRRELNLG